MNKKKRVYLVIIFCWLVLWNVSIDANQTTSILHPTWGVSKEFVKTSYREDPVKEEDMLLVYETGVKIKWFTWESCQVSYAFVEDRDLVGIVAMCSGEWSMHPYLLDVYGEETGEKDGGIFWIDEDNDLIVVYVETEILERDVYIVQLYSLELLYELNK